MALGFLQSLFGGGKPSRAPLVESDEILPMFDFDARPQVRNIIIGWTLRFDDVLDADQLHVALARLLEIGNWRKLGGRLRETVSSVQSPGQVHSGKQLALTFIARPQKRMMVGSRFTCP